MNLAKEPSWGAMKTFKSLEATMKSVKLEQRIKWVVKKKKTGKHKIKYEITLKFVMNE